MQDDNTAPSPTADLSWLDHPDGAKLLAKLDQVELVHTATDVVQRAKMARDESALRVLGTLRTTLLMRGERPALGMVLQAQADVATGLGQHQLAAKAFDTLWGLRELLEQPFRAHTARISHGEALFHAGDPAQAEQVLRAAQQPARELALGGEVHKAATCLADTLARLAGLLMATERREEGELWLDGARDIAPDEASRSAVDATPARFSRPASDKAKRTL